ncbi:MAG: class I SAM-dependent methyltransferase [Pseudomonadota bacterium]
MGPEDILPTYARVAQQWDGVRGAMPLVEKKWLKRMMRLAPGRRVLDLGCGSGRPIASYLAGRGALLTGVDGAEEMVAIFRRNVPVAEAVHADMRRLNLDRQFDAILSWDSFFHLADDDQRAMFAVFARHATPGAALMFTSGHVAGEAIGQVEGHEVYHSSLSPLEYERLLKGHGFTVCYFRPEDPDCGGHTIWLARFTG